MQNEGGSAAIAPLPTFRDTNAFEQRKSNQMAKI